ncbi:MerR family transcriptional regulator [Oceanobacillus bengalensis]|nr:MerR family transcriptional regulator [Oceanobacillus bengalensis]
MLIGEFSKRTGVSIRTLHYYDEKGLLKPEKNPISGHRIYSDRDVMNLHKIMTLKALGYTLEQISEMIRESSFDMSLVDSLRMQQKKLEQDKEDIETTLVTIRRTILLIEGEKEVNSNILMSLISSMQTEKAQREWAEQFMEKDVVESLYEVSEEEKMKWEKATLQFYKEIKRLVGKPANDEEVMHVLKEYFTLILTFLDVASFDDITNIFTGIESIEDFSDEELSKLEAEVEKFVPSPLTKEEQEWLDEVMAYYIENQAFGFQTDENE